MCLCSHFLENLHSDHFDLWNRSLKGCLRRWKKWLSNFDPLLFNLAFIVIWFDKNQTGTLSLTRFWANSVDLELGFPWLWPGTPLKQTLSQGFGVWQNRIQKFIASNYIACSVYCHRYEIKHVQVKVNWMIKHNDTETI